MYNVNISVYEGPFDLLFDLIEKNQIDIYDIPINEITDKYISEIKLLNLDESSEFIMMASTLIEIKSRMLLPVYNDITGINLYEDPRKELIQKLLSYKKYKKASEYFMSEESVHNRKFFKEGEDIINYFEEPSLEEINKNLDLEILVEGINNLLKKLNKTDKKRIDYFNSLKRDNFTVEDKINVIVKTLNRKNKILFYELFNENSYKEEIIVSFLALLELLKRNFINIKQKKQFGEILIIKRN